MLIHITGRTSSRIITANAADDVKFPLRSPSYMRLARTSVPAVPPVVAFTRSKILRTVIVSVVTTTAIVEVIWAA